MMHTYPRLSIIDRAIASVENAGWNNKFSCIALNEEHNDRLAMEDDIYVLQYAQFVRENAGKLFRNVWWDHYGPQYNSYRIVALKAFRQACIEAAQQ